MTKVQNILDDFGKRVNKLAKINIGASRTVKGKRRVTDNTGKLRGSLSHDADEDNLTFSMLDYGVLVDAGQLGKKKKILKGFNKSVFLPRGKGFTNRRPHIPTIKKWILKKPIRLRDLKTNQFISRFYTPTRGKNKGKRMDRADQATYLIAEKIFNEGIQPTLFFSDPFNEEFKDLPDDLIQAFSEDIEDIIE